MGISLVKGQAVSLEKQGKKFELRCSWDESLNGTMDIDIMALCCDENERAIKSNDCLIFYNNLISKDGAIQHTGDERTGSKDGWDEVMKFDISKLNQSVKNILLLVNIHEGLTKYQNFGLVRNLKMELYDIENNNVVAEFTPDLTNSTDTCLVLGEFVIKNSTAYFKAVGIGHHEGLDKILTNYGVEID